ncbi:MAG: tRNA 5-methoxyuridine(34)/uridine 5-oxyacetic acid(34) synthase CmoB [Wenzhouxiangella sp.]|nr:MAG: tRNA 5-methoxyuridine(34)/uridine 5-oxyacetic acid(34) synthase CmoB [Wenzhouxiangella sp.]
MSISDDLHRALATEYEQALADDVTERHRDWLSRHGDWPRWRQAREQLPAVDTCWQLQTGRLVAGADWISPGPLAQLLGEWIPWRKGPLRLGGVDIDTEWRSDLKWARLASHVDLAGERVLDVGAGNAYFGWCMLASGARCVFGCDPTQLFVAQHEVIRHFTGPAANHLIAARLEDLPPALGHFDRVFSMGVLYHRRDHLAHLEDLKARLRPGGGLVLETLILDGPDDRVLVPADRYANMRNVHTLPTLARLQHWLEQAGWESIQCIDRTATSEVEQRRTEWMPFHSLSEALDPDQPGLTREGHPAPLRVIMLARKPG